MPSVADAASPRNNLSRTVSSDCATRRAASSALNTKLVRVLFGDRGECLAQLGIADMAGIADNARAMSTVRLLSRCPSTPDAAPLRQTVSRVLDPLRVLDLGIRLGIWLRCGLAG